VIRPHHRRSPLADFIDWNDYRIDGLMGGRARPAWGRRRTHPLLRIVVILAVVWFVGRLLRGNRRSGWL